VKGRRRRGAFQEVPVDGRRPTHDVNGSRRAAAPVIAQWISIHDTHRSLTGAFDDKCDRE
jgi:hypothetical protein